MKSVLSLLLLLLPGLLQATTTTGATLRALNIDGFVATGAFPGANNTFWETDEVFQGFNASVNWYMTWDDTNLYLGRIGGNNQQGSILYLRAEYPGATYTNNAFNYDGLNPGVAPMGGINFAAYMKDTPYDEFRTWSGGVWSAPNTSLVPFYSTQAGPTDHMEVVIPWNSITAGNGKPANVRVLLYQVVEAAAATNCTPAAEFVYAESPWGTGNPGDGPSVGVNDGTSVSARQPGGCDVGDSTATRWWGCYPVVGGVGSNGWVAQLPDAGPDSSICETATAYVMQGNTPAISAMGTWAVIGQPAGSGVVGFSDPNNPATLAQNLDGIGDYTFTWAINYGGCPSPPDTVVITRFANPPNAIVSPDQNLPCGADSALILGNDPGPQLNGQGGIGQWVLISGQGAIANPFDTLTWVTALGMGPNVFAWQITNGPCQTTSAQVTLSQFAPVYADAGNDLDLCAVSIATLAANDPVQIQTSAQGVWTQASGPSQSVFTNSNFYNTNVANLTFGTYQFVWSVTNGSCPPAEDTLTIRVYDRPLADAGGDQFFCADELVRLEGNNPFTIAPTATGAWRQLSGPSPASLLDSTLYNTTISNLEDGTYKFAWIVRNGPCLEEADVVSIFVTALANDGVDTLIFPLQGSFDGSATLNPPSNGTAPYMYSLDGSTWQASPTFNGLAPGIYSAYLMDDFGCMDSLSFEIEFLIPPPLPKDTLRITTGFSPNGDGTNDTWQIPGMDNFPNAEVSIYNAWGGLVYYSDGSYIPWDGRRNGKLLPPATYYFVIELKLTDNPVRKGSLTLFR